MEFEFQKSACPCLETALREVQNVEQTQEIKLPDGMPDIGRVLAAWGQTILRRDDGLDPVRAGGRQRGAVH